MNFEIYPAGNLWWLYAIFISGAILMVYGFFHLTHQSKSMVGLKKFALNIRFIFPVTAILMLVACWLVYKQDTATLEITGDTLVIHAGWYSQEIERSNLRLEEAQVLNLKDNHHLQPVLRTNGTGAPTLKAGWFILRNRDKAFLLITKTSEVLYLPTRDFIFMASLKNPHDFLELLSE